VAFKFQLETVLKHRKRLEEMAQREYAEAQAQVDVELRALEQMYDRMDEVRDEISKAQASHSTSKIEFIRQMETFLGGHKILIERKRAQVRELLMVAEEKQEALIAAAKERKVLTKLKDKRLAEYREWLNQVEIKISDDQTTMTRARKAR
jgi:flagellar FliJ protein